MRLQADASLQELFETIALTAQAVDDVCTWLDKRGFEHVGQQGQDGVERLELVALVDLAVLNARQKLGQHSEVQDEGSGKKRVLNKYKQLDGLSTRLYSPRTR